MPPPDKTSIFDNPDSMEEVRNNLKRIRKEMEDNLKGTPEAEPPKPSTGNPGYDDGCYCGPYKYDDVIDLGELFEAVDYECNGVSTEAYHRKYYTDYTLDENDNIVDPIMAIKEYYR